MTREDVIFNIMTNYGNQGVTPDWLDEMIRSGERQGFSYQIIYTGLRMAIGNQTGREELFTVKEVAEALGATEDEILQQIEELKATRISCGLMIIWRLKIAPRK